MKTGSLFALAMAALVAAVCTAFAEEDPFAGVEAVSIFDGKSLEGWEGDLEVFRIQDGAIVGGSMEKPLLRNEFLCTKAEYADFELKLKAKLVGADPNAGVQIRSRRVPDSREVAGYQADLGQKYWGCLYDEARRCKVLAQTDPEVQAKAVRKGEWNDYVIRCVGKHIQLWLNGVLTTDYVEADDSIEQTGIIGVQVHGGPASEAWYKDITIKVLPKKE